jgi:nucleoside-diphosphate-sugar epimerase
MNVTVTGAAGTIGLACVHMLVRAGHRARAFVRRTEEFRRVCREDRVEVVEGDVLDRAAVATALEATDAVIHCVDFPLSRFSLNFDALQHVLGALGTGRQLIYPGNVWVYGPPESERVGPDHPKASPARLGQVKADLEKAITAEWGTVVHLPEVYGPGVVKGRLHAMFDRALAGKTVFIPGDLDRLQESLYIEDAARALIAPLGRPKARGADYTAAGCAPITPRDLGGLIFKAAGRPLRVRSVPIGLWRSIALLQPDRRATRDLSYLYEVSTLLDGSLIRRDLGWMPEVNYADGVRRTVRWLRTLARTSRYN